MILSFCVVAVITLLVGFIGWSSVRVLDKYVNLIGKNNLPSIRSLNIMNEAIVNEIISVLTAIEDKKKESDNEQTTDTAGETDF